jgi:hypothetical protein
MPSRIIRYRSSLLHNELSTGEGTRFAGWFCLDGLFFVMVSARETFSPFTVASFPAIGVLFFRVDQVQPASWKISTGIAKRKRVNLERKCFGR